MQIKDLGIYSPLNGAPRKDGSVNLPEGESFLHLMRERMESERDIATGASAQESESIASIGEIEAIAARSRIIRAPATGDVTDFLGLLKENRHLLRGVNIDSLGLNELTAGSGALKPDDASALRQAFDTGNLAPKEQAELFTKLNGLGVLSASDVKNTQLSVTPEDGDVMDYLAGEAGFKDVSATEETNPKGRLELMIQNEKYVADHVQSRYGQNVTEVLNLADSHGKVLDILSQI